MKSSRRPSTRNCVGRARRTLPILSKILEGIDFMKVDAEDLPEVARQVGALAEVLVGAERGMRLAIEGVVKKLPKQGKKATESLSDLMDQPTLRQITAVTAEVQRRLETLSVFRNRILDERTYEIRGDNSIHRLLEGAMWIVDERYWLMHSNEALRTIVGDKLSKVDKRFEKKRPDFVWTHNREADHYRNQTTVTCIERRRPESA